MTFKWLSLKPIKQILLEGESPTLSNEMSIVNIIF